MEAGPPFGWELAMAGRSVSFPLLQRCASIFPSHRRTSTGYHVACVSNLNKTKTSNMSTVGERSWLSAQLNRHIDFTEDSGSLASCIPTDMVNKSMMDRVLWDPLSTHQHPIRVLGKIHHTASHSWASHQGTNVECRVYERGGVHVMPVWVDHFYFKPCAGGDAVSPLVLGNDDDQAGDEENVEMEESPEGEESDARPWRAPVRPTMDMVEGQEVCQVPYRPWRSFCVRGRGQSMAHRRV